MRITLVLCRGEINLSILEEFSSHPLVTQKIRLYENKRSYIHIINSCIINDLTKISLTVATVVFGLKIPRPQGHTGSIPVSGTNHKKPSQRTLNTGKNLKNFLKNRDFSLAFPFQRYLLSGFQYHSLSPPPPGINTIP